MNTQSGILNYKAYETEPTPMNAFDFRANPNNFKVQILSIGYVNLDQMMIDRIMCETERNLQKMEIEKSTIRKVLLIVIETLQNIYHHGYALNRTAELVSFTIHSDGNYLYINSVNYIAKNLVNKLAFKLNSLLNSSISKIKKNYLETLGNGALTKKGGASLGLMTIVLKTEKQVDYDIKDLKKDYGLFYLESRIQLNNNK